MLGSWSRRTGFFVLDFLKGSKVTKHYSDIANKMSGEKKCFNELPELLKYSKENVPYYSKVKGSDLNNFPVVKKNDIMPNMMTFNLKNISMLICTGYQLAVRQEYLLRQVKIVIKEIGLLLI